MAKQINYEVTEIRPFFKVLGYVILVLGFIAVVAAIIDPFKTGHQAGFMVVIGIPAVLGLLKARMNMPVVTKQDLEEDRKEAEIEARWAARTAKNSIKE